MKLELPPKPVLLPSPVLIIGTYDSEGKPNIMNAAWGGIVCSNPPCISVSIREARLTYHNMQHSKAFTVNFPSEKFTKEADFVGIVSGRDFDKFEKCKLTHEKSTRVNAPIVKEFPYALECSLIKQVELGSHIIFIGEIIGMVADSNVLNSDKLIDIEKVKPIMYSYDNRAYYNIGTKVADAFSIGKELMKDL
jgi:flavin reductase (DIM6/NTAB) family NADH-FMN oxidoreductase RutF